METGACKQAQAWCHRQIRHSDMSPNREILLCCRAFSDSRLTLIMNISQIWSIYINFPFLAIWYLQPIQWKGLKCLHSPQWFQTEVIVEAHSSTLIQKCSFCHFKWKSATEEVKWDITAWWEQWLWLFHCSICLVFDNEIEVVLRDSPVCCLEPYLTGQGPLWKVF